MYLARTFHRGNHKYSLRQSYFDEHRGTYSHRQIFDLGREPGRYIERLDERVICFAEPLEDAVAEASGKDPNILLEKLLWDFLPAEIRRIIGQFQKQTTPKLSPLTPTEKAEISRYVHIFDRRRLFYIRYGAVDQSRIYRVKDKLYRPLLFKSRDEKEYYIREMERALRPDELKKYIYVIFNLQQNFPQSYAAFMPEALAEEQTEDVFLEELCRLNDDSTFWQDEEEGQFLREHLQGYLISFFDSHFTRRSYDYDFYQSFRRAHRNFVWPQKKTAMTDEESSRIFGKKMTELKKMTLTELTRLFRKSAKEHHPDSGGKAEDFIKLLETFEILKANLRKK
ncbi:MAG: hypothetical protein QNJ17_02795 [Desulfocapsaceae bacterium]|nr:hypothetical protein [Desulfocapsaceae bacterium]